LYRESLIYALLVISFFTAGANSINDSIDYKTDAINNPKRPIPKGEISPFKAMIFSFCMFLLGIFFSLFLNQTSFILSVLIALPLIIFYSIFFKSTPIFGNLIVSLIISIAFLFIASINNNFKSIITISLLGFLFTFTREFIKDIADYEGDKVSKIKTFPVLYGIKKSIKIAVLILILLIFSLLIPYFFQIFSIKYLIITIFGICIPIFGIIISLIKFPKLSTFKRSSLILKLLFLIGLLAIYFE